MAEDKTCTLIVTLLHVDKFSFNAPLLITRTGTWFWLIVYISVPIIVTILFILQFRAPGEDPPRRFPLASWARYLLILFATLFLLPGAGLLVAPLSIAPLWPWPLPPLTGRAIGAWLIGIGILTGQAAWENDRLRVRRHGQPDLFLVSPVPRPHSLWERDSLDQAIRLAVHPNPSPPGPGRHS